MSLTVPAEELGRFKVSVQLTRKTGALSLTLQPSSNTNSHFPISHSGYSVHFETVEENGVPTLWVSTVYAPPSTDYGSSSNSTKSNEALSSESQEFSSFDSLMDLASWNPDWRDQSDITSQQHNLSLDTFDTAFYNSKNKELDEAVSSLMLGEQFNGIQNDKAPNVQYEQFSPEIFLLSPACSTATTSSDSASFSGEDGDISPSGYSTVPSSLLTEENSQQRRRRVACLESGCDRQFVSEHTRKVHMKTHKPRSRQTFPCTMGCPEIFSRQHDRLRHEVTKHGRECQWSCHQCRRFFSFEKTLKNHKCTGHSGVSRWSLPNVPP